MDPRINALTNFLSALLEPGRIEQLSKDHYAAEMEAAHLDVLKGAHSPAQLKMVEAAFTQFRKETHTRINLSSKLAGRIAGKLAVQMNNCMEQAIPTISTIIAEADKKKCLPCEVKYNWEDIGKKLIEEEEQEKKRVKPKKQTTPVSQPKKKVEEPEAKVALPVITIEPKLSRNDRWISQIYTLRSLYPLHPRVTKRWKTKDPEQIREFLDKAPEGGMVKRYKPLSDEEIKYQRACHYLTGTEKILTCKEFSKKYSFETETGYGMLAQLITKEDVVNGIIYFGIGKDGVMIHRYFEKKDNLKTAEALSDKRRTYVDKTEESSEWIPTTDFDVTLDNKGVFEFTFTNEEHSVKIFPFSK